MQKTIICCFLTLSLGMASIDAKAQTPPAVPAPSVQVQPLGDLNIGDDAPAPGTVIERPDVIVDPSQKAGQSIVSPKITTEVPAPGRKPIPEIGKDLTVLELFSTQACTFCPKADALMKQLTEIENLIALSCHVDYFDVTVGSLSQPICSTRQIAYENSLDSGPKYTPQMIVNGRYDAIGYMTGELNAAFEKAEIYPLHAVSVLRREDGLFDLALPDLEIKEYKIWLLVFDQPKNIIVQDGANRGKEMVYYNIVSNAGFLGNWNGAAKTVKFDAKLNAQSKGFAVLVHDADSEHIVAAEQYLVKK